MREILFRGKRVDNGEWVEGFYHFSKWYLNGEFTGEITYYILPVGAQDAFRVNPATVGQYTGLMANGKRIFEGDIVRVYDTHNVKVTFDEGCFHVEDRIIYVPAFTYPEDAYEVIGNIWDNPELLEV